MVEKKLKDSDERFGLEFEVKKNTKHANRIGFSNTLFKVGEKVYVISEEQHFDIIKDMDQVDEYKSRIKELEKIIVDNKSDNNVDDLKKELQEKDDMINTLKERVDSLGQELESNKSQPKIHDKDEIDKLKEELESERSQHEYWKSSFENIMDNSDELSARNEELIKENERLKNTNDEINQTNKLLNENLIASNANFKETTQELQSNHEATEKELKETITKQQTHIDELSKKVESLIGLKEYIPPTEHYAALEELKDKINVAETELSKAMAEVDMKLKTQKSEMDVKHTEEKAQMLVVYNQQLNHYKLKYNGLAKDYNHLLGDASSLSRINILLSGRHKAIVKDKEPVELEEIEVEEPTETIEYVPKDNVTLI
ncbi:TPA: hypothetical protein vir323_00029 [Caudoviricetes sp. vir323]|uniref:Uncharacterized protein n=1 Tax=Caudoviricetes sp. vir323 TaxID=3068356 RepID=A0AA87CCL8_9CAUD|nr:TPA_asm: hypothetical protein vir323_00029 [Caudoviricetes sp. vir323]